MHTVISESFKTNDPTSFDLQQNICNDNCKDEMLKQPPCLLLYSQIDQATRSNAQGVSDNNCHQQKHGQWQHAICSLWQTWKKTRIRLIAVWVADAVGDNVGHDATKMDPRNLGSDELNCDTWQHLRKTTLVWTTCCFATQSSWDDDGGGNDDDNNKWQQRSSKTHSWTHQHEKGWKPCPNEVDFSRTQQAVKCDDAIDSLNVCGIHLSWMIVSEQHESNWQKEVNSVYSYDKHAPS